MTISTLPNISNTQSTLAGDFNLQTARGKVPGAQVVNIFAYSVNVNNTIGTLWEGTPTAYVFPASAVTMTVVSTSALDNTDASILIKGLDSSWNQISETLFLNGTGAVTTVNSYLRINSVAVVSPGTSQLTNVGTITLKQSTITYAQINPSTGANQAAILSVPAGYTFFLTTIYSYSGDAGLGVNYVSFQSKITDNGLATPVTRLLTESTFLGQYTINRGVPFPYSQKNDIQWQLQVQSGTQAVSFIVMGYLIANTAA